MTPPPAEPPPEPPSIKNPRLAIALLAVIMGAQAFYASLDIFGPDFDSARPIDLVTGAGFAIYVVLIAVFAFAAWRRSPWAWRLGVAVAAAGLILAGLQIAAGDTIGSHSIGMVIDGAILFYLFRPNIRAIFDA